MNADSVAGTNTAIGTVAEHVVAINGLAVLVGGMAATAANAVAAQLLLHRPRL